MRQVMDTGDIWWYLCEFECSFHASLLLILVVSSRICAINTFFYLSASTTKLAVLLCFSSIRTTEFSLGVLNGCFSYYIAK